jgi:hypothetical protein
MFLMTSRVYRSRTGDALKGTCDPVLVDLSANSSGELQDPCGYQSRSNLARQPPDLARVVRFAVWLRKSQENCYLCDIVCFGFS